MLRGVLLHVVKAAGPVNLAVDGACGNFGCGVVDYVMGVDWIGGVWRDSVWPGGGVCVRRVNDFYHLGTA
jgi:hypothetical protein